MKDYVFTLPAPIASTAFTISESRGIGSQSNALGASMIRTEDVFPHVSKSIDVFKREHTGIVCVGLRSMNAVVNQDLLVNEGLKRSDAILWTRYHQKAHMVLPTSVNLTSDEFLAQNQHWLDLLPRSTVDMEVGKVVKEHVLQNIDQNTARLVPEQYRTTLFYFCGSINEKARQDWLRESPLPEVTVNRPIPLPKIVETQPMRQAARKLERFAFKLKKTNPTDAADLKHISDTITLLCDVQYQAEIKATVKMEAMEAKFSKYFQKIQLLNCPAMTDIIDNLNKEQEKVFVDFRGRAITVQDEDGASACQMTNKEWLLTYRSLNDAKIQRWIDLYVELSGIETGIPETWKALIMDTESNSSSSLVVSSG
ncbi:hypothetical protein NCS57_00129400 [Fusarium keratoplasticum]|uniref:Uncharacterized protein n=1 Tax=Fusarium keratoplasticum TaxID=1328300 RepID=A0ACC0REG2_9HYPO|nr:hypothetical protein NCS57_00129400 [Fusarium keratoplasticum]KAI8684628.1 hypothetical protein NCS57_00129400 [Fusarium keratoplasticum]